MSEENPKNNMDKRASDPLKYMIAMGLHLLSWTVVILISLFPFPWFLLIWIPYGIYRLLNKILTLDCCFWIVMVLCCPVIFVVVVIVLCIDCCKKKEETENDEIGAANQDKKENAALIIKPQNDEERKKRDDEDEEKKDVVHDAKESKPKSDVESNENRKGEDKWNKIKKVFFKLETVTGISMILNFGLICYFAASVREIPYSESIQYILSSIPLLWKVAISAFMITFGALITYEGMVEIVEEREPKNNNNEYQEVSNKEDDDEDEEEEDDGSKGDKDEIVDYRYQTIVFRLLLHGHDGYDDLTNGDPKEGLIFHYALIAAVVGLTLAMICDQIDGAISDQTTITVDNIYVWCSIIFTNASAGYLFISRITVFMVNNFVLTSYYDGCKTCRSCLSCGDDDDHALIGRLKQEISTIITKNEKGQ